MARNLSPRREHIDEEARLQFVPIRLQSAHLEWPNELDRAERLLDSDTLDDDIVNY